MAKETTDGLLIGILKELQELSAETKKLNRTNGKSNVPGNAGIMSSSNIKNLDAFGNSLQIISSAIIPLSKLSTKNIEDVGNNIKLLSTILSGIKFSDTNLKSIKNMMSAITSINQVFDGITDNFFKSFLKFSPLRAKVLGKQMAKFYKILFEQFEQEKFSDLLKNLGGKKDDYIGEKLTGFSKVIDSIMKIDTKNLLKLGLVLKMFPSDGGKNLAEFFRPILQIVNELPDGITNTKKTGILKLGDSSETSVEVNPKVGAFINIVQLITSITMGQIAKLVLMGKTLNEKGGENIGKFFAGIIDAILKNDEKGKRAETASKIIKSMTFLLMTLTISVVALTVLIAAVGFGKVVLGFITLGAVVGLAYGIMRLLSSDKFKERSKSSIYGALGIAALIGTLTISLLLLIAVAKKPVEQIAKGLVLFAGLIGATWLIMKILSSNSFKESSKESLISVGAIVLLLIGMSLAMLITISVGKHAGEILKGGLLVIGFTFASIFLIKVLAKVNKSTILKGLITTTGIALMITGLSLSMKLFAEYLQKMQGITLKGIIKGTSMMAAMIAGMVGLVHILSPLAVDPLFWAGFGMVEIISVMIASISGAMLLFTKLLHKINELKPEDIKNALIRITEKGGMIDALAQIVDSLGEFGLGAAIKTAIIGTSIRPVIKTISQFVDVVQKMASLKIADEWDKNGRATHYIQLKPEDFKTAATNLTEAFSDFLTNLSDGLSSFDLKSLAVLEVLFPRQSLASRLLTGKIPGIGDVIHLLGDFIKLIQNMASLNMPIEWDKNGNPSKYMRLTPDEFKKAAVNLSEAFSTFLSELATGLESLSPFAIAAMSVLGGPLGELLTGIGNVFNPIIQIAAGKIAVGNQVVDIDIKVMKQAAIDMVGVLQGMINPLITLAKSSKKIDHDELKTIFNDFTEITTIIAEALNKIKIDSFETNANNLVNGITSIINYIAAHTFEKTKGYAKNLKEVFNAVGDIFKYIHKDVKIDSINEQFKTSCEIIVAGFTAFSDYFGSDSAKVFDGEGGGLFSDPTCIAVIRSENFKTTMENTAGGLKAIKPYLSSTPKQIVDLANAIKQFDQELLQKDQERTKAMQSISTNFKDMSAAINKLNNSMAKSLDISKAFDVAKTLSLGNIVKTGANIVSAATHKVKDTVSDIFNPNKKEEEQKALEDQKQKDRQALANAISVAVSAALDAWAESHKDLTVQFNESPEKIFGEVYHN